MQRHGSDSSVCIADCKSIIDIKVRTKKIFGHAFACMDGLKRAELIDPGKVDRFVFEDSALDTISISGEFNYNLRMYSGASRLKRIEVNDNEEHSVNKDRLYSCDHRILFKAPAEFNKFKIHNDCRFIESFAFEGNNLKKLHQP